MEGKLSSSNNRCLETLFDIAAISALTERSNAAAAFLQKLGEIVTNRRLIAACEGVKGIAKYRAQLERQTAKLERELAQLGERVLELGGTVPVGAPPDPVTTNEEAAR